MSFTIWFQLKPLKSLKGSTVFILFPIFITSEKALSIFLSSKLIIVDLFCILAIEYNILLSITTPTKNYFSHIYRISIFN